MAACVVEDADLAIAGADEKEGASADFAAAVVARIGDLGLVAKVEPAAVEEVLAFHLQDLRGGHCGTMDAENVALDVVKDERFSCHGKPSQGQASSRHRLSGGL